MKNNAPLSGRQVALLHELDCIRRSLQDKDEGILQALLEALTIRQRQIDRITSLKLELGLDNHVPAIEKKKLVALKKWATSSNLPWELCEPLYQWLFAESKKMQETCTNKKRKEKK